MKILFLHNKYFPYSNERPFKHSCGGAALTNVAIIQEGEKRGHAIDIVYAYANNPTIKIRDYNSVRTDQYDLAIISHIPKFLPSFIERIADSMKFVRWDHAYDFCGNGVDSMTERCFNEKCKHCKLALNQKLHLSAKLSVFQSPLHKKWQEEILGIKIDPAFVLVAPIDVEIFKSTGLQPVPNSCIVVGSIMKHKGIENVLEFIDKHKDWTFTFIGSCREEAYKIAIKNRKNCKYIGHVDNWMMPFHYSAHQYYLHLPLWPEPSSRSAMEATLMGCKTIFNKNVGIASYDFINKPLGEIREIVRKAPSKFWEKVEEVVK